MALHASRAGRRHRPAATLDRRWSCSRRASSPTVPTSRTARCPTSTSPTFEPFPKADELWAWAHVHVNRSLAADDTEFVSKDMAAVLPRFLAVLTRIRTSRIRASCARAARRQHGLPRLPDAGLRERPARRAGPRPRRRRRQRRRPGTRPAARMRRPFPYYYRWFFRTGDTGDFESLVRLLVPKPVDPRVGFRDMDVLDPGSNVPGHRQAGARRDPEARRRAAQPPDTVPPRAARQVRDVGRAVPAPAPDRAGRADQPARRSTGPRASPIRSSPRRCTAHGTR